MSATMILEELANGVVDSESDDEDEDDFENATLLSDLRL